MKGLIRGYGYVTQSGYMGYINGQYILFATEEEYKEYIAENTEVEDDK